LTDGNICYETQTPPLPRARFERRAAGRGSNAIHIGDRQRQVTITAHNGDVGAVTIPETINGLPVASIGGQSFGNDWEVNHVTIPNSVTSIGVGAFDGC